MNRNTEVKFSSLPTVDIERSRFDRSFSHKTTFSSGKLIPIYYEEVLPGDTITLDTSMVCRMTTPIYPVMDNCNIDMYYFFVPNRLVWDHWKEFCGEDTSTSWETPVNYQIPQVFAPGQQTGPDTGSYFFDLGTLPDYFGLPCTFGGDTFGEVNLPFSVSALPFRAYYLIWNEYFRAQALQDPVYFPKDDADINIRHLVTGYDYVSDSFSYLGLMPVSKYHDYFTSALPSPQKGQPVLLPLGTTAPILTSSSFDNTDRITDPLLGVVIENGVAVTTPTDILAGTYNTAGSATHQWAPTNLYTDLSAASAATINDLRNAFVIQQFMELQARGGSRYTEIIQNFFGVTSPDARLQRPEYLGGKSIPVNIDQVVQTSSSDNQPSPLGSTSAFSLTGDNSSSFTYSSTEHGMIIGLCCVRPQHTYQQGIEKKWSRKNRYDFYYPVFANISEQPVYTKELYVGSKTTDLDTVFGYQEAWADYRYSQNKVTGCFRNNHPDSLSPWHYADYFTDMPVLSDSFVKEDPNLIGRTLAYQGNKDSQFLLDVYFKSIWTRPMPIYSLPGLTRL